jgi:hypothetical protein
MKLFCTDHTPCLFVSSMRSDTAGHCALASHQWSLSLCALEGVKRTGTCIANRARAFKLMACAHTWCARQHVHAPCDPRLCYMHVLNGTCVSTTILLCGPMHLRRRYMHALLLPWIRDITVFMCNFVSSSHSLLQDRISSVAARTRACR